MITLDTTLLSPNLIYSSGWNFMIIEFISETVNFIPLKILIEDSNPIPERISLCNSHASLIPDQFDLETLLCE